MGRHSKLSGSKSTDTQGKSPPSGKKLELFDRAEGLLGKMLRAFEDQLDSGEISPTLAREAAGIARAVATMDNSRRARKKLKLAALKNLSLPQVMAFLRQVAPEERSHVVRELQAIDAGGSVLS